MSELFIFIILAYLLGSIPFGKIMGLRVGIDIQKHGSGNIGFANCLRFLGLKSASFVLVGDIMKGFIPVYFALKLFPFELAIFVGLTAIAGHVFPIWLKGNGGKGIATGLGVLFALNLPLAFASIGIWLILFAVTKLNSLASIMMIFSLPLLALCVSTQLFPFSEALLVIGTFTHRKNINNLIRHKEKKLI